MYLNDIFTIAGEPDRAPGAVDSLRLRPQRPADRPAAPGRSFTEARLLDIAHRFQQATDWHRRIPAHGGSMSAAGPRQGWEVVIGLETHAQLSTASKIFSGASTAFGAAPNTQASAVDIALPGVLPVLNRGAVERAIRFGLAVGATINRQQRVRPQELLLSGPAEGLPDLASSRFRSCRAAR